MDGIRSGHGDPLMQITDDWACRPGRGNSAEIMRDGGETGVVLEPLSVATTAAHLSTVGTRFDSGRIPSVSRLTALTDLRGVEQLASSRGS